MKVFLFIFVFFFQSYAYAQDFIVIVNMDGPLKDADTGVLREVYLGEKRFADTTRLMPLHLKEGPAKDAFLRTVVGMSPKEYKHYCIEKLFQGGMPAHSIGMPVDIIEFVGEEKGAVAYLPAAWTEAIRSGVAKGSLQVMIIDPGG